MGRHVRDELRRFISSFPLPRDRGRGPGLSGSGRGTEHHPGPGSLSSTTLCSSGSSCSAVPKTGGTFRRIASPCLLSLPVPIQASVAILAAKLRCKGGSNLGEGLLLTVQPSSQQTPTDGPARSGEVRGTANANHCCSMPSSEGEDGIPPKSSSQLPVRPNSQHSIMPTTGSIHGCHGTMGWRARWTR